MSEDIRSEVGFLVLADISGFTAFVAGTELEHGALVTGVLLEAVMRRLSPPLEIQELEGDAVFALGPERALPDGSVLPALLADAFAVFKEEQRRLARDESCACRACGDVPNLDLKLVVHHGRFVRQTVGGRSRVAGPDVIIARERSLTSVTAALGWLELINQNYRYDRTREEKRSWSTAA